jgi:ABC-type lipoprotein export system ATPase subunit
MVTHDANVAAHAQRTIRISDGLIQDGAFTRDAAKPPPPPARPKGDKP